MNRYKQYFVNTFVLTFCFGIAALLSSCSDGKDSPDMPTPDKSPKNTTLLIYAVATNSLTSNLVSDKNEMLQAASQIDLDKNNIFVFETQYK